MSLALEFHTDISVVGVPGGLQVCVSQALKRSEGFLRVVVLDVPSVPDFSLRGGIKFCSRDTYLPGAFGTEIHLCTDDQRKHDGAAEHKPPPQIRI